MNSQMTPDARITAYLSEGPTEFPLEWREEVAGAAEQIAQRRTPSRWRSIHSNGWLRLAAAVLAIGLLAVAVSQLVEQPQVGPPSTVTPWTPDAVREAFPALNRPEPSGGAGLVEAKGPSAFNFTWVDPLGDVQIGTDPRVDLRVIIFSQTRERLCLRLDQLCLSFIIEQGVEPPIPEPENEWLSYGLVLDRDGDGQADGRFGLDNIPEGHFRAWWTDPLTGATKFTLGTFGSADGAYGESGFPLSDGHRGTGSMWITPSLVGTLDNPHGNFYMWAALIRDGEIVSLDYAPDAGWLTVPD